MSQVLFYAVTKAQYEALEVKQENALYFLSDVNRIYKGSVPYTHPLAIVESFPEAGVAGTLYIHKTTLEARSYDGSNWLALSPAVVKSIGEEASDSELPTAKAVKDFVSQSVGSESSTSAISDVSYDPASKSLSVTKGDGEPTLTALSGLFDSVNFDAATGVLSFTTNGGEVATVNLPKEQFLSSASYDSQSKILTLTLNNETSVTVNLSDLADVYSGKESDTASVSVADGEITANVKISQTQGNALSGKIDGLYAEALKWQTL